MYGNLYFDDQSNENRSLNAINIVVRGTGNLTVHCQVAYNCEIVIHGDRFTNGVEAGGTKFGSKSIAVFGYFHLEGKRRTSSWTKLKLTSKIGSTSLSVQNPGDFQKGDRIVVTSTDFDPNHAEIFTIKSVNGNQIIINKPLTQKHRCDDSSSSSSNIVCGEVGLLSQSVSVRGGDSNVADSFHSLYEHEYGVSIKVCL